MEIERTLKFIWEDEDWLKKILIAAALLLTGVGSIGVIGWMAELASRVAANNEENPLPEWEEIGQYFLNGLKYIGVTAIWSLPALLLIIFSSILPMVLTAVDDAEALIAIISILVLCMNILVFFYILVVALLAMPLWVQIGEDISFGELINPANALKLLRANAGGYIVALLVSWLAMTIASLGSIACLIGVFFTSAVSQAMFAHLTGQATAQARLNLENQPAVPPA